MQLTSNCILLLLCLTANFPALLGGPSVATRHIEGKKPSIAIDLKSCRCRPVSSSDCEIAIGKSFVPGSDCSVTERLCCSFERQNNDTDKALNGSGEPVEQHNVTTKTPNVRIKEVGAMDAVRAEVIKYAMPSKKSPAKKCRCKTRDKCPPIYTDYSFGFYCTYDKVRCCEPLDIANKTVSGKATNSTGYASYDTDGRLINIVTPSNSSGESTGKNARQCVCVEESRCSDYQKDTKANLDTFCPDNLVQCCGNVAPDLSITPSADPRKDQQSDAEDLDPNFLDHRSDENLQPGSFISVNPVGLPVMKIPDAEATNEQATSTLPPPQLPDQYYYPASNSYSPDRYREPVSVINPEPIFERPVYRTWVDKYGNKYAVDSQGRATLIATGRGSSKTFLASLAEYFG